METYISIGQVKRDISELVNRVAYGRERVVLTSRGKPKAVLVSIEDYERLQAIATPDQERLLAWKKDTQALAHQFMENRQGEYIDVDAIREDDRAELEKRDDWITDCKEHSHRD